jgi:regulator of sigma E protease
MIWSIIGYVVPFITVLSLVVFFHELGHFLIGRWCGVRADVFSLGFGPELFGFNDRYGTHWRLAAFPLGGYVKFHGESTTEPQDLSVSFSAQNVWKRAAIVAAGPIANFLLAMILFTGIFYVSGRPILLPTVDGVAVGSTAEAAGFHVNDLILSIGGVKVNSFEEVQRIVQTSVDTELVFTIERDSTVVEIIATPHRHDIVTEFGTVRLAGLGVQSKGKLENWHTQHYDLISSARLAGSETWYIIERTGGYIKGLIAGQESPDQISGPIRIAEVSGAMAQLGIAPLLNLAAIMSISVGLLNLFPIPLLDGGYLFYYGVEAVRGKVVSNKVQDFGFKIGIMFIATLMILATYNDILRLTSKLNWG